MRASCATCIHADSGTCNNHFGIEGITEISSDYVCENFESRPMEVRTRLVMALAQTMHEVRARNSKTLIKMVNDIVNECQLNEKEQRLFDFEVNNEGV